MGKRRRGREGLLICSSCGRRMPRDKMVTYERPLVFGTELKTADDVFLRQTVKEHYCISCGKHRRIFEKKKRQAARKREVRMFGGGEKRRSFHSHPQGQYRGQHSQGQQPQSQPSQSQPASSEPAKIEPPKEVPKEESTPQ